MKLLLAEDERELSGAVVRVLKHNNYTVDAVYDGAEALEYLTYGEYDGVILDIMMPKADGLTVLRTIRAQGNNVPVILLTAKSEVDDRVEGLDAGADDYLSKPFAMKELLARIRAMTRRKNDVISTYTVGNLTLNPKQFTISADKGEIRLSGKEFQMMEMLVKNGNVLISTEKFMESVWGYDSEAEINGVWVYISSLRKKLQSIGANVNIKAVRGLGYRLEKSDD
ncbi:MAG: response regulator transcription factor [Eubacteriales bacterium]|nr:response regulator transcription factor [Christensenellaceae bacterium]MCI7583913.1 response regulator transcription factor [Christensenellaceae bacterium]MCI7769797.1 response regulator transcription factor [Christensenellaceae bacterium]MDD7092025.1 response regulator transcription factor [Christensenellaceae bacterium]MDY3241631.1 response regulator transcription factor [Eubacteriales bacterium]